MWVIDTLDEEGGPQCPICHTSVEREGFFCSPQHWEHFHAVVYEMGEPVDMNYLDLHEQPWWKDDYGTYATP